MTHSVRCTLAALGSVDIVNLRTGAMEVFGTRNDLLDRKGGAEIDVPIWIREASGMKELRWTASMRAPTVR